MASQFENNQTVSGEFRKKQYEQKSAVDLDAELKKGEQKNKATKELQDSINNTSIKNNTNTIASTKDLYGAQANNYNASAGMTKAQTTKQGFDNDLQKATQPGIISAVNVGSDSKIAQLRTTKTAAQDMQSDIMRGAIGKGYQVGADGGIGNSVGDFLPGAGARIRGEDAAAQAVLEDTSISDAFDTQPKGKWESLSTIKNAPNTLKKPVRTTRDLYNAMYNDSKK